MKYLPMLFVLPSFAIVACGTSTSPYYAQEGKVSVSSVLPQMELGNVGGEELVISGSGFGTDPAKATVQIGNQNAEILSIDDGSITVVTPRGPLTGGAVDVAVGNADGQGRIVGGYTYAVPGNGLAALNDGGLNSDATSTKQIAYISISNDSLSCYGGLDYPLADELGAGFCGDFAYTGSAGIEGRSEALEFVYPRGHTPYFQGKGGFSSAYDISWEEWSLQSPPQDVITFDDEGNVEDMRLDMGRITIENPNLSNSSWCGDLNGFANFTYNGDETLDEGLGWKYPSSTLGVDTDFSVNYGENGSCYPGGKAYQTNTMNFCMVDEYEVGETLLYEPEWPIGPNFFQGPDESGIPNATMPVVINITAEKAGITNQEITLPPYFLPEDIGTIEEVGDIELVGTAWSLLGLPECPDTTGDRLTLTDDAVYRWNWEPVDWSCDPENPKSVCLDDNIKGVTTYVKVTLNYFAFSWLGGDGLPIRATISVPDDYNFDPETGLSYLELPAWVLYSFPSAKYDFGYVAGGGVGEPDRWTGYGDPDRSDYGYIVIATDRVTEYTLDASFDTSIGADDFTVNGDLVVAYSTGDMAFFLFDNPLDNVETNTCADCLDNDGDGWVDALDVDCILDPEQGELILNSDYGCSDGIDNDGDGFIDAFDPECTDGTGIETIDCSDEIDNDGDGWVDIEDPDCSTIYTEDGFAVDENDELLYQCNDGVDNDGDGWVDSEDPICTSAEDTEDDGFAVDENDLLLYGCNDGIDNDGHGDIDNQDWYCNINGATNEEEPELRNECIDTIDNDGDAYIDGFDPDCELTGGQRELVTSADVENYDGLDQCYDGIDNDCDGFIDAEDPGCVNDDGDPDGWRPSEDLDGSSGVCTCDDAIDNDSDGWFDLDDPDCISEQASEAGFGSTQCNNDVDDDGDGFIDALDPFCYARGASSDSETINFVSFCNDGIDNDADGWIDSEDPDCEYNNGVQEAGTFSSSGYDVPECGNDIDDDGDGFVDGNDPDCNNWYDISESTIEICDDGIDNDSDSSIDCADSDCDADSSCIEEVCDNNIDDDSDGLTDCDDDECDNDPLCP